MPRHRFRGDRYGAEGREGGDLVAVAADGVFLGRARGIVVAEVAAEGCVRVFGGGCGGGKAITKGGVDSSGAGPFEHAGKESRRPGSARPGVGLLRALDGLAAGRLQTALTAGIESGAEAAEGPGHLLKARGYDLPVVRGSGGHEVKALADGAHRATDDAEGAEALASFIGGEIGGEAFGDERGSDAVAVGGGVSGFEGGDCFAGEAGERLDALR